MYKLFSFLIFLFLFASAEKIAAQVSTNQVEIDANGNPVKRADTSGLQLQHRDPYEDSITISYHHYDSTKTFKVDSSVNDFYSRYPVPWYYVDLGNFGNAAHSLLFDPVMKPGWDPGFHAYDIYNYNIGDTKFFNTSRPYTELAYLLGSKGEQMADLLHTQNRKSNFNFTFQYRFLNAPGSFKNQNSNDNNIRINAWYINNNKRYGFNLIFISNKIRNAENGGIVSNEALDTLNKGGNLTDPFQIPVHIGNGASTSPNPFSTQIAAGITYKTKTFLLQQHYDIGQKDSIVTDSVTYKLFYPRLRFQHTFNLSSYTYAYEDDIPVDSDYAHYYNYAGPYPFFDTVHFQDRWLSFTNEFSIISYPEKKNLNQFLKLSAALQQLSGAIDYTINPVPILNEKNVYVSAEYRNRTRNQKWDVEANGQLYVTGNYSGNYNAYISLQRKLNNNNGSLEIGFQNVNETPSYIFDTQTSFPIIEGSNYKDENISKLFATINFPKQELELSGSYYLLTNYTYFDSLFKSTQYSSLFNVLHVEVDKRFRLSRHWNWYTEVHLQQTTPNAPVNLPLVVTRSRIAFEGNFYHNLFLSTGVEIIYNTPYHPDAYSPLIGQFYLQNSETISNRPDANIFLDFRIKSFKAFVRLEHINSVQYQYNSISFTDRNYAAPLYPERALWIHLGIWWNFIN